MTDPVRVAAAWSWRLILILAATGVAGYLLSTVTLVIIPVLIAALLAGPLFPLVRWLRSKHVPAGLAAGITVLGLIGFLTGLLVLAGQQVVVGFTQLSGSVVTGTRQLLDRLQDTPLDFGTADPDEWINDFGTTVENNSEAILNAAMSFGTTAGHVLTGILILLFTLLFFLIDGERIWPFTVRLFSVPARRAVNGADRYDWEALVQYARAQGLVAAIDAVGIGVGAALLGVPLALPIGILVFLGSFIPIVGAVATGAVAVLVALVANGTTNALLMLGVVVLVQQLEGNVLQPLILGKAVSLHPLAVFLAVATGSILYGIAGALFAVPIMAFLNTVVRYLTSGAWRTDEDIGWEPYYYPGKSAGTPGTGPPGSRSWPSWNDSTGPGPDNADKPTPVRTRTPREPEKSPRKQRINHPGAQQAIPCRDGDGSAGAAPAARAAGGRRHDAPARTSPTRASRTSSSSRRLSGVTGGWTTGRRSSTSHPPPSPALRIRGNRGAGRCGFIGWGHD